MIGFVSWELRQQGTGQVEPFVWLHMSCVLALSCVHGPGCRLCIYTGRDLPGVAACSTTPVLALKLWYCCCALQIHYALGNYLMARKYFSKAVDLNPKNMKALWGLHEVRVP
jgi:tetratricopeptide (TPR) repeat protein